MLRFSLIFLVAWITVAGYASWSGRYLAPVLGPIPFGDPVGAHYRTPSLPLDRYHILFLVHYSDHDGNARYDDDEIGRYLHQFGLDQVQVRIRISNSGGQVLRSYQGSLSRWVLSSGRGFEEASAFWGEYDRETRDAMVGFWARPFERYEVWAALEGSHPLLEQVPIEVALRGQRDDGYYHIIWGLILRGAVGIYILVLLAYLVRRLWAWMRP